MGVELLLFQLSSIEISFFPQSLCLSSVLCSITHLLRCESADYASHIQAKLYVSTSVEALFVAQVYHFLST